MTEIIL